MVQRIEYAVFPDTPEQALLTTGNKILGHVHRSDLTYRGFRDWLREQGIWNKDTLGVALSLFDIHHKKGEKAALGAWGTKFFGIDELEDQKTALFERLLDQNTLLVKYVMEALDMEGGGRLHSTYELHRMLTSYVYPGQQIRLPDFQAWIKWMVCSGRIKLIGIRWGLTDEGKAIVPRLRMIDVDEFLEEEEEEEEEAAEAAAELAAQEAAANAPEAAATAKQPAQQTQTKAAETKPAAKKPAETKPAAKKPAAKAKTAAKKPAEPAPAPPKPSEEDALDLPPEAPPIDDAIFEKYAAQFEPEAEPAAEEAADPAEVAARPPVPRQTIAPSRLVRASAIEIGCTHDALDVAEVVKRLREHGRQKALGGGSLLVAYGLETRLTRTEAARHLFMAGLLARLSAERPDGSLCDLFIERVGGLGPAAVLLDRPEALAEVTVRWGFAQGDAPSRAIRAALFDAVIGGRALARKQDTPTLLAEAPSTEVLFGMLSQGLLRGAPTAAVFWLIREMVRIEAWKQPAAREVAFIPSRANRMMAYRLRLIDSHFASSQARLIDISRTLCKLLPSGSVEAAAFEDVAPDDHLRFDCPMVPICQSPCGYRSGS